MAELRRREGGQALVILILALVGLLAAVGLAIDGGMAFLERRRMQNAADAAALAGARELGDATCDDTPEPAADDDKIAQLVSHYAQINGVADPSNNTTAEYVDFDEVTLGNVGGGFVPEGTTGVSVTVTIDRPAHFLGFIGMDTTGASARAVAMAGPLRTAGGARPFGLPEDALDLLPGAEFTLIFKNCSADDPTSCPILDADGDQIGQHRGWMNLAYTWKQDEDPDWPRALDPSCDADTLKAWMEEGFNLIIYADCLWSAGCKEGDFIHARSGTNSSAVAGAPPSGTAFYVPVYDIVPHYSAIPGPKAPKATAGGGYYFHIVGYTPVIATGYDQGTGAVTLEIQEGISAVGELGRGEGYQQDGGSGSCRTRTVLVTLWR